MQMLKHFKIVHTNDFVTEAVILRPTYTNRFLLTIVNAIRLPLELYHVSQAYNLPTTVWSDLKKVVAFWKHALKAYDNRKVLWWPE